MTPTPTPTPNIVARAIWTAPTGVRTGRQVTRNGTASQGNPTISCTWSFEDQSGSTIWETRTGCSIAMTFQIADTKYFKLTVRDRDGETHSRRRSFTVTN